MSNPSALEFFLTAWCQAYQQRQALLHILGKPNDHLLRDAGLTREDALRMVSRNLIRTAWDLVQARSNRAISPKLIATSPASERIATAITRPPA
jgi:uncharacterized protein YjiS (DUF1127 family)